jgi:uncharacterized beta-barrel protein YwiB (DUF1934 family)
MKNCLITLKTISSPVGGEADIIELTSPARFSVLKNGRYKIVYSETALAGYEGAVTEITCSKETAVVKRKGNAEMRLCLDLKKKHYSIYKTPFGEFSIGVSARKIETDLTENGGRIHLKYALTFDSNPFTENEIIIDIKTEEKND